MCAIKVAYASNIRCYYSKIRYNLISIILCIINTNYSESPSLERLNLSCYIKLEIKDNIPRYATVATPVLLEGVVNPCHSSSIFKVRPTCVRGNLDIY